MMDHTTISTYMTNGETLQIMSEQVISALCNAIGAIGKDVLGIAKDKIGTHSIHLGSAMAIYLGKCPVTPKCTLANGQAMLSFATFANR
jgi:hypothetical protein